MSEYLPIKNSTLARDMKSLGLVETDPKKIDEYKHKKLMATSIQEQQQLKENVTNLQKDVESIKTGMDKIFNMLEKLVDQG